MFGMVASRRRKLQNKLRPQLEKLAWTMENMAGGGYMTLCLRLQGHHKVTGGITVVKWEPEIQTKADLQDCLMAVLLSSSNEELQDVRRRINDKMSDAYSMCLRVSGRDQDGDSLGYEMRFNTLADVNFLLEHGLEDRARVVGILP